MSEALQQLVAELNSGALAVVDLTQPLGPDTPVIGLPEMFVSSPGVTIEEISRYDDNGPAWYWNKLSLGEQRCCVQRRITTGIIPTGWCCPTRGPNRRRYAAAP